MRATIPILSPVFITQINLHIKMQQNCSFL